MVSFPNETGRFGQGLCFVPGGHVGAFILSVVYSIVWCSIPILPCSVEETPLGMEHPFHTYLPALVYCVLSVHGRLESAVCLLVVSGFSSRLLVAK